MEREELKIEAREGEPARTIVTCGGERFAEFVTNAGAREAVRAVNAHGALVEALEKLQKNCAALGVLTPECTQARAALKLARKSS